MSLRMILSDLFDDSQQAIKNIIMNAIKTKHLASIEYVLDKEQVDPQILYDCAWQAGVCGQDKIGKVLSDKFGNSQPYLDGSLIGMIRQGASIQKITECCKKGADLYQNNDVCMLVAAEEGYKDLFYFFLDSGLDPNKVFDDRALKKLQLRIDSYDENNDCPDELAKQLHRLQIQNLLPVTLKFHARVGDTLCEDVSYKQEPSLPL